ncbi:hypothetical protein [Nonomuraea sp. NPDC050783]|uniref:hypothetical protein n=1 Tax=Nonomuraea sp. NPDC050783 TaxID=3154634 RepID=UPI003467D1B1
MREGVFEEQRPRLSALAYRLLGSAAEMGLQAGDAVAELVSGRDPRPACGSVAFVAGLSDAESEVITVHRIL